MSLSTALLVEPEGEWPPGPLVRWLQEGDVAVHRQRCGVDPLPDEPGGYSAVLILGGSMGVLEDARYPWLSQVRRLLAASVTGRVPVLAIGLGAQLLAVAAGGSVRRMPGEPEVGTLMVAKRDAAVDDPLFAELPLTPDVLALHGDEVGALPPHAVLMASSPRCQNQAFRVGGVAYGLQFHIESTPDVVLDRAAGAPEYARFARSGQLEVDHLRAVHADIEEVWRPFVLRFARLARGEIAPATPTHVLPLT
jgi:GMP synthase-like glutamine amidotransferase